MSDPAELYSRIQEEVGGVLIGNEDIIGGLTIALLTSGHVLLEGVPGVAKTTAAQLFAQASGLEESRIQMTPDILPADITGTTVYREATGTFDTRKGPVFANVVLADEINRATPKAQSALLEAMAERNVTIEGSTYALPSPFLVVATQNPIEMEGTFVLPEAQRDRFQLKLNMDVPEKDTERTMLDRFDGQPQLDVEAISEVVSPEAIGEAKQKVQTVYAAPELKGYILDLVGESRAHPSVEHGASPRASLAFLQTGKARAAINRRSYVIPDDVKAMADPVLRHRLVLKADAEISDTEPAEIVEDIITAVEPPDGIESGAGTPARAASDGGNTRVGGN